MNSNPLAKQFCEKESMWLETNRLIIRSFRESDIDDLYHLYSQEEVMHYSISKPFKQKEQAISYLKNKVFVLYENYGFGPWALCLKENSKLIGISGPSIEELDQEKHIELIYRLDPAYWGKGLASEAVSAIIHYAFYNLGLKQLQATIHLENTDSITLAKRLGMKYKKESELNGSKVSVYILKKS